MSVTKEQIDEFVESSRYFVRKGLPHRMDNVVTAMDDELRALRKVADAAAAFITDGSQHGELVDALEAVGR